MFDLKLTKLSTLFLSILSLVLGLFGLNSKLMMVLSSICAIFAFTIVIFYLDTQNYKERFIWPIHGFALHALIFGATMLLFGVDGALFTRWYHAILDALVVATLLKLMNQKTILIVIASVITGVLSLINLQVAIQMIFCALAVFSLITVVRDMDEVADIGYLVVLLLTFVLEKFVKLGNIEYWFHLLFTIFGLVIAYLTLFRKHREKETVTKTFEVDELDSRELENAPIDTREIEVETVDLKPVDRVNFAHFDREWVNSEYSKLTLEDLYNAPISAFKGVGDIMANKMDESFQIKTIKDLANSDFFKWALEILKKSL